MEFRDTLIKYLGRYILRKFVAGFVVNGQHEQNI